MSSTFLTLLILGAVATADRPLPLWFVPSGPATKENCNAEGQAVLAGTKEVYESPTSEIFIPEGRGTDICIFFSSSLEWQAAKGLDYNSKSCSEGCCYFTPASSWRVQALEAHIEENIFTWFRAPLPSIDCGTVPSRTFTSRLILNNDNNDIGIRAAICVKAKDKNTFEILTGSTTNCKGKCCVFNLQNFNFN